VTAEVARESTHELDDASYVLDATRDTLKRRRLLQLLKNLPKFMDLVRKLSVDGVFRVVMTSDNAHLFKQSVDGTYKPFLHNGKHFVENVDLIRVPPDYLGTLSDIALAVNMAAFAARLEAIEVGVRNISRLMADTQRGRLKGALDALAVAQALVDRGERRTQTIAAARDVVIELGAVAGQLRAHIAAMPKETTDLLDGWLGSRFAEARAAFTQVKDDVESLIDGLRLLLRAYQDLEEPGAAREAISRVLDSIGQAGLPDGVRKARLLPFRGEIPAPELYLGSFLDAITFMQEHLLRRDGPPIAIDIGVKELLD
jgi:uncharacterized protein YukE